MDPGESIKNWSGSIEKAESETVPYQSGNTEALDLEEGGWAGWTAVLGVFLIHFCTWGCSDSFGVYQDYYVRVYMPHSSPSAISWIGSTNSFLGITGGLISGRLYDKGYFRYLLFGGALLCSVAQFMLSLVKPGQYYQALLAQGIAPGLANGMMYVPCMAILSHYFTRKYAFTVCIAGSGASLATVLYPIMMNHLLNGKEQEAGDGRFQRATRISAGMLTGMLVVACIVTRPRREMMAEKSKSVDMKDVGVKLKKFAKDKAYVAATIGLMLFDMGYYIPPYYFQLAATQHGLDRTFAFYALTLNVQLVIMNGSAFITRIICAPLCERIGVGKLMCGTMLIRSVLVFSMVGLGSIGSFAVLGVLYGVTGGTYLAVLGLVLASLADDVNEIGLRMGVGFAFAGTPVAGALLGEDYGWWRVGVFGGAATACGGVWMLGWYGRDRG
ncbi:major facilitator superfamily domain-containing protein [Cyathus striatus]|nr:major facilitator superfamily domain-containing protein [Cyathus striatus]